MKPQTIQLDDTITNFGIKNIYDKSIASSIIDNHFFDAFPKHTPYTNAYTFLLVKEGACQFTINRAHYSIVKNDLLLLTPNRLIDSPSISNLFKAELLLIERSYFESFIIHNPPIAQLLILLFTPKFIINQLSEKQANALSKTFSLIESLNSAALFLVRYFYILK